MTALGCLALWLLCGALAAPAIGRWLKRRREEER